MLENGFNHFPRASRSIRARGGLIGKKLDGKQNRSFEILASVAGTLLDKSGKYYDAVDYGHPHEGSSYSEIISDPMESDEKSDALDGKCGFGDYPCFSGKVEGLRGRKLEDEVKRNKTIMDEFEIVTGISGNHKTETRCASKDEVNDGDSMEVSGMNDENDRVSDGKIIDDINNEMSQKIFPFKKRKLFNNQQFHRKDDAFDSHKNRITSQPLTTNSPECNVKLSIKSFKVPELFIDISTNATVGSLKRTIMEAVTSILGDGLHVGILVQGKKVRDDTKTLIQTGISQDDKSHNLGFVLEPKHSRTTTISTNFKNGPSLLSRPRSHGLTRQLESRQGTSKYPQPKNLGSSRVESDLCNGGETPGDMSSNKGNPDSKSLVPVPKISMKALALVHPLHRKSGHHEYGQRRIRRPFSVTEVEALVRAVEKLGTGRWRDVKFHAFDNAKHRTYVDLKDKWKTLVHTARISPQQRRGEPVPQELLDRVLAAQAYWSHRQAKQHAMLAL